MSLTAIIKVPDQIQNFSEIILGLPASKCAPEMMDDHRMTAATSKSTVESPFIILLQAMGSISLLRCGKNSKSNTQSFVANYETVGFYAL